MDPVPALASPAVHSPIVLDHEEHDLGFTAPKDAASVIPNYSAELLSHAPLGGRLFTALPSDQLDVGMTVLIFGFEAPGESAATMVGIAAGYLVVNRLTDGSCDAVRAYVLNGNLAAAHPFLITFLPGSDLQSVFILSTTAISTRNFPVNISESAKMHGVKMVGAPTPGSSSALPPHCVERPHS
jgi:hypothetical protein